MMFQQLLRSFTAPEPRPPADLRMAVAVLLGVAALAFDLLSRNPQQVRYVLGAAFLICLSAFTFHQARG